VVLMKAIKAILAALIAVCSLSFSGCGKDVTHAEAEKLSRHELTRYAQSAGISVTDFLEIGVTSDKKYPWIFDYETSHKPKHLLRIYVKATGETEIHRMIE
jgi:hypothetical protein